MYIETITHKSGEQLPILLDKDGLPLILPNEFILSRRALATNTLVRNLRELSVLYAWIDREKLDLLQRISSERPFNEAEIKGGIVEFLRRDWSRRRSIRRLAVSPNTFNQRLATVRQFFGWVYDVYITSMSNSDTRYERMRDQKKGLTPEQAQFLVSAIDPKGTLNSVT